MGLMGLDLSVPDDTRGNMPRTRKDTAYQKNYASPATQAGGRVLRCAQRQPIRRDAIIASLVRSPTGDIPN